MTIDLSAAPPSAWRPEHVAAIAHQTGAALPPIRAEEARPLLPDHVVWDMWPIQQADAATVVRDGRSFWFFLAAPRRDDPDLRHDEARIRLLSHGANGWQDHGNALPDVLSPGSREWSGSAVLEADGKTLTLYFTAAGRRGEPRTFEQRLFETRGQFDVEDGVPRLHGWGAPVESVRADGVVYAHADQREAVDGAIKGFRDPGFFRDPADGADYLLFVGSDGAGTEVADGVIGLARHDGEAWRLAAPLVTAIGVNGELERPHILVRDGLYYLFWSTQRHRFARGGPSGPTGLYAMVAGGLGGPWRPVNGTGLVAANPESEPRQAYCWWVTGEWEVISFVDIWGLEGRQATPALKAEQFGGTVAPLFRLEPNGDRIAIAMSRL